MVKSLFIVLKGVWARMIMMTSIGGYRFNDYASTTTITRTSTPKQQMPSTLLFFPDLFYVSSVAFFVWAQIK